MNSVIDKLSLGKKGRWNVHLFAWGCLMGLVAGVHAADALKQGPDFIRHFCVDCHQPPKPKAKLDLTPYIGSPEALIADALEWDKHLVRVRDGVAHPILVPLNVDFLDLGSLYDYAY